jgi:hypothetical protein
MTLPPTTTATSNCSWGGYEAQDGDRDDGDDNNNNNNKNKDDDGDNGEEDSAIAESGIFTSLNTTMITMTEINFYYI